MIIVPKGKDIKAARNYLDWTQQDLGDRLGLTIQSVNLVEKGKQGLAKNTEENIVKVFAQENIIFHEEGGFKVDRNAIVIHEGREGYLKVLEDTLNTCSPNKEEVLFLGSSDERSSDEVNKEHKKIYEAGIPCKYIISSDDNYILGPLEEYRQVDSELFLSRDAIVIYGDKVMFFVQREGDLESYVLTKFKNIIINDKEMAEMFRQYFYRLWDKGNKPLKSKLKQIFFSSK